MPVSQAHLAPLTQTLQFQPAIPTVGPFKTKHCVPYTTWHSKGPSSYCSTAWRLLICPLQVLVARWMPPAVMLQCKQMFIFLTFTYIIVQCCYWNMQVTAKCTHSSSMSKRLLFICALYTYCLPFLQLLLSPI